MNLLRISFTLLFCLGALSTRICNPYDQLQPIVYEVLNAASDHCARFPTPQPRALWIPGISEQLVLENSVSNTFTVVAKHRQIEYATMVFRVSDNSTNPPIVFNGRAYFNGFHHCTNPVLELYPRCYETLDEECYQCFSNWNVTLTAEPGSYYANAIIILYGRISMPNAQTGNGANNKNVHFGLSGWCSWAIQQNSNVHPINNYISNPVCDINVDLKPTHPPSVKGDPHFIGFRGQRFDFHGVADGVFNLITDVNFHMNARFVNADLRPKKVHKTYIGDVGVLIGSHKLQVSCNRGGDYHKVLLDDQPLDRGLARTLTDENNALILRDASDKILIDSHPYVIRVWFSSSRHSSCHLSIKASYTPGDYELPHGVLGQTANPDVVVSRVEKTMQGEGIIEGDWRDYRIDGDDLLGTSFKYNRFDPSSDVVSTIDEEDDDVYETLSAALF